MTLEVAKQRLADVLELPVVEGRQELEELLRLLDRGEVEGDAVALASFRSEVLQALLNLPSAGGTQEGLVTFYEEPEGTEEDAVGLIRQLRERILDELRVWEDEQLKIVQETMAGRGTIGFARGGWPIPQYTSIRVRAQAFDMRYWLEKELSALELSYRTAPETAYSVVSGRLDEILDEWERIRAYGTNAVQAFESTVQTYLPMLNLKNMLNQVVIGKAFQFIGGVIGESMKWITGGGKLGQVARQSQQMRYYGRMVSYYSKKAATNPKFNYALAWARQKYDAYKALTIPEVLRHGLPPGGYVLPEARGVVLPDFYAYFGTGNTSWFVGHVGLPTSTGVSAEGSGTWTQSMASYGALGFLSRMAADIQSEVMGDVPELVEAELGPMISDLATSIGDRELRTDEVEAMVEAFWGSYGPRLETVLRKRVEAIVDSYETEVEPPVTEEEIVESEETGWQEVISGLYDALCRSRDWGQAVEFYGLLLSRLEGAVTPAQQEWAASVAAIAEQQLEAIAHGLGLYPELGVQTQPGELSVPLPTEVGG